MDHLLQPINEEIFKEKVHIRFNNINEGFDRFKSFMLQSKDYNNVEEKLITFMKKVFDLNGEDNSFVDFYLSRLDEEARNNLFTSLNDEDKKILKRHIREINDETIYFKLSKESIPFITRLNTREALFCTFYFTKFS